MRWDLQLLNLQFAIWALDFGVSIANRKLQIQATCVAAMAVD